MKSSRLFGKTRMLAGGVLLLALFLSGCSLLSGGDDAYLRPAEGGATFLDERHGLEWRIERSGILKSEEDVQSYLQNLDNGQTGRWRLPTRQELYDLFANFDLKLHGDVRLQLEGRYWLRDEGAAYVGTWQIGDQCGPARSFYQGRKGYVRAVRKLEP